MVFFFKDINILILSNSKAITRIVSKVLNQKYKENHIVEVNNLGDAWSTLHGEHIDLILFDQDFINSSLWNLKNNFITQLVENNLFKHIPIIVMANGVYKNNLLDLLRNGANDYIYKPFTNDELLEKVDQYLK